jgi:HEPN domain-containing protein
VNRTDLQQLAELRLEDARILLQYGRYAAAYYLCGYAVECGLKACIARQIREHEFPPSATFSRDVYTHKLADLVKYAGLSVEHSAQLDASAQFKVNWDVVQKWTEQSRYEHWTQQEARELLDAANQAPDGVMQWIRQHW